MKREDELSALRATFFEEADERISEVEGMLLELEQRPHDDTLIAPIFRAIHSLKSGGAACELFELAKFAHAFENLLDQLRKGRMRARPSTLNILLEATDTLTALVDVARGSLAPIDEQEIEHVVLCINHELATAGIVSAAPPPRVVASDGPEGVVWFDDVPSVEVVAAPSPAPQAPLWVEPPPPPAEVSSLPPPPAEVSSLPSPPAEVSSLPPPEELPAEQEQGALLSAQQLSRLVDLSVELVVSSSALVHAVSDGSTMSADRVRRVFTEVQAHASEIESRLAQVRSDEACVISEVVFVRAGEDSFFVPLSAVESYFSVAPRAVRMLPMLGEVLSHEGNTLPVHRLRRVIGRGREDDPAAVAVLLRTRSSNRVLLVDEVRTQARVVVRPLSLGFCRAAGMLGAAVYAGTVVLVLDPDALGGEPRAGAARAGDHSIQIL